MRLCHKQKQEGQSMFNAAGVKTAQAMTWQKTADAIETVFNERHNR
jgi:hypothetical protein